MLRGELDLASFRNRERGLWDMLERTLGRRLTDLFELPIRLASARARKPSDAQWRGLEGSRLVSMPGRAGLSVCALSR